MKPDPTRFEISGIWSLVLVLALLGAACGGPGPAVGAQADQQVGQTADEPDSTSDGSNENAESVSPAESEDRSGESGPGTTIEVDILTTIMEEALAPPELPAEATDLSLGGTPDTASAAAIAAGLEDAGVVLDGITLSVLPVSGIGVSLLVLEMSDEYLEKALPGDDDGADMTETLLALPEILSASIVEFVTIYRGVDETGPFTMTFAVSISDLRTAHEAGTEIGEELVVQYERGS